MNEINEQTTAQAIDAKLAQLWVEEDKLASRLNGIAESTKHAAGAKYYYRGRQRVTDTPYEEARATVAAALSEGKYLLNGTSIKGYSAGDPTILERYDALQVELEAKRAEYQALAKQYTGWSRFYLVTSSAGHIHSSTCCQTCRYTTTYGWLPELSGKE